MNALRPPPVPPQLPVLDWMGPLASNKRLIGYQPYWAVRGHLLADAGRTREAHEALTLAMGLSTDDAVRWHLEGTRAALGVLESFSA